MRSSYFYTYSGNLLLLLNIQPFNLVNEISQASLSSLLRMQYRSFVKLIIPSRIVKYRLGLVILYRDIIIVNFLDYILNTPVSYEQQESYPEPFTKFYQQENSFNMINHAIYLWALMDIFQSQIFFIFARYFYRFKPEADTGSTI